MSDAPERRRVMRVDVPRHLRGGDLAPHFVHLLNLSPLGARVTHLEPWHQGVGCAVDLPPSLGPLRLPGRVVWTRHRSTEQTLAGDRRDHYESGIEFTNLTPEQQTGLIAAPATLQTAQAARTREEVRRPPTPCREPTESRPHDAPPPHPCRQPLAAPGAAVAASRDRVRCVATRRRAVEPPPAPIDVEPPRVGKHEKRNNRGGPARAGIVGRSGPGPRGSGMTSVDTRRARR
jgi:PilZ domain